MHAITIADRVVGPEAPPLVVAELSGNHNQSLERALALVDAAAEAGAHAVKLQTYTADTITLPCDRGEFRIEDPNSLWYGETLHQLYDRAHTPWDWHPAIFERCRELDLLCFSSPFDDTAVDFLESLDSPCYKIASFEIVDLGLIRRAAATGRPLILSTGMATLAEIDEAVRTARAAGCRELMLLKCTSTYPASPENSHLLSLPHLAAAFACPVGLSDHTLGIGAAVASVALGAGLIEKHFTLSRADGGVDAAFSLEPAELRDLVAESQRAWSALGRVQFGPTAAERGSLVFRRSLYVARDIAAGETLTAENVRSVRPGYGLHPRHMDEVLGRRAARDLPMGTPLAWDLVAARED